MSGRSKAELSSAVIAEQIDKTRLSPDRDVSFGLLSKQLGYLLRRAQLWAFRDFHKTIGTVNISPVEYCVLIVAHENPGISQTRLGHVLEVEKANLARVLNSLEERGLLKRTALTGRSYAVNSTERGSRFVALLENLAKEHEDHVIGSLGPQRYQTLLRALQIFVRGDPQRGSDSEIS